ncbi:peptidase domain-containing ABC transporter [Sanguibacter antarcticus]|uniref:ABC-type bacteriocin/lantibiotic exporter with double-glycine peptidase domain n=1 Tax=Sanguibacter antarcticus TaxID=372484 RepID=A0A2A9EA01_9MICO|nr:peptidase domain-containing ABC transporter [Sanguibacter antarcticus]PFG35039.1 ABC-type bacteriocin/lantibiotic exporter with double-glycine peptidase domain [Sanguibacter antarcticus]
MISRLRPTIQITPTECGLCCASMILTHHRSKESLVSLRTEFDVGRDGLSVRDIRRVLESRGLAVTTFRANLAGLRDVRLPVIAFWRNSHFVVVERIVRGTVTVLDPARGRVVLSAQEFEADFAGIIILATPTADFQPDLHREPWVWREFLAHMKHAKAPLVGVAVFSLITYGVSLAVPMITQRLVDGFVADGDVGLSTLTKTLAVVAAVTFFGVVQAQVVFVTRLTVVFGRTLMGTTFKHLLTLPYRYFGTRSPGELIYRLASVSSLRDLLATQVIAGVLDAGMIVVVFAYMASKSVQLALVALGFFLLISVVLVVTRTPILNALNAEMTEFSKTQGLQIEAVSSIASLRVAGVEDEFFQDWSTTYERGLARMRERSVLQGWVNSFVGVARTGAPLVILLLGLMMAASGTLSLGEAVAFQALSTSFFALSTSIFAAFSQYLVATSYLERLVDITRAEPEAWPEDGFTGEVQGRIEVRDLRFRFTDNSADVLQGISFDAAPGQKIAIVGTSGSGKTTLGQVLSGLQRPTGGSVTYDGRPITEFDRRAFYSMIGVVPQEIDLQNKSIRDNITMGGAVHDPARVVQAAEAAQIHHEILQMPMGYDTRISEMGANISGGQRQRIALARAIYKNPKILLLDEATSSLDVLNETRIAEHLRRVECTRIVIAHRMSTIVDADRILVMQAGRIMQAGTHEELFATEGHYRDLFMTQQDALDLVGLGPVAQTIPSS